MKRHVEIAELLKQGWCIAAIANKLGCTRNAVRCVMWKHRLVSAPKIPEGYVTLTEACDRVQREKWFLYLGIRLGMLQHIMVGRVYCVRMADVEAFLTNEPYRQEARAMAAKLFSKGRSKPSQ